MGDAKPYFSSGISQNTAAEKTRASAFTSRSSDYKQISEVLFASASQR
jgi:hypothetical protein